MRYVLPALIVCIVCAASRGTTESLLAGMLDPAFREWVHRPGEMYGFWLWRGPGSLGDPVARVGANATSIHLMMHLEETADGARVVTRPIDDPALDELAGVGVGLGEHNNPFFVRYPEWFWKLRQEARMKDAAGKTIRAGENPVPSMLDPLLVSLAKEQMAQMVGLLDEKAWVRYWVIGGEQSWPDYFGLPAGDYSPSVRRHFTAWKRLHNTPPPSKGGGGGRVEDWRDFRDSVVVDRYAGYTAWLHALDQTRPAMVPTHGNPFTMDFRQRLGYVAERLNAMPGIRCSEPEGAFYLFPDIRGTGLTSEGFAWGLLEKGKVATLPGSAFGACGEGYVRIACTRSLEVLAKGMDRMEAFVKSLKG